MALIHWIPLNHSLDENVGSHSITLTGGEWRVGKTCPYSLYFNGNSFLKSSCSFKDGQDISICFWIKLDLSQPGWGQVFTIGNSVPWPGQYLSLNWSPNYTQLSFSVSDGTNVTQNTIGIKNLNDDKWHHVTAIYSDKKLSLFLDGVLNSFYLISFTPTFSKSSVFSLGGGISGERAKVCINDFRIYDKPLSAKEVKKISQGLILHYNSDHILGYNLLNHHDWYTKNNPRSVNMANVDGWVPLNVGCDIVNGKVYTLSADMDGTVTDTHVHNEGIDKKSCSIWLYFKHQTWAEGAYDSFDIPTCFTRTNSNFRRISKTRYAWTFAAPTDTKIKSCSIRVNTYSDGTHPITVHFWNFKLEEGDVATPFSLNRDSQALDSSGFGYDGTIVSEAIEKSTDHKYKKNIVADGNPAHYIQSDINPSFLTSGATFNVWYKNITNKNFLLANGQEPRYFLSAMNDDNKWCDSGSVSGEAYYIDGQLRTKTDGYPKDGQWHMYTFVGTSLGYWTALYWNRHDATWAYNGPLGDIRLYATALSAADVKALYNETRVTHPMQFLISNSSALSSLTSSNPVLADGELVVVRSTDTDGKTCFNIRKGNGVNNFNSLPWKQIKEATLKGWRSSFTSDTAALDADTGSYTQLGGTLIDKDGNKYYQVDYIENTSDSFIQTDYLPRTSVTELEVQFRKMAKNGVWNPVVGLEQPAAMFGIQCSTYGNNDEFRCYIGGPNTDPSRFAQASYNLGSTFYQKNTFKISYKGFYINGAKIYTPPSSITGDYTASSGVLVDSFGGSQRTYGRWYSVKFSENGKVVRNYIPVKSASSDAYGLFDTINNKFFPSNSSHGFIGGFDQGRVEIIFYDANGAIIDPAEEEHDKIQLKRI